jgi:mRNA interferase HigB
VKIIFKEVAEKFGKKHPDSKQLIQSWSKRVEQAHPKHLIELKETFQQADQVGNLTVFNLGNNYRLIAFVIYKTQQVHIRHVLTHSEYDEGKWKK